MKNKKTAVFIGIVTILAVVLTLLTWFLTRKKPDTEEAPSSQQTAADSSLPADTESRPTEQPTVPQTETQATEGSQPTAPAPTVPQPTTPQPTTPQPTVPQPTVPVVQGITFPYRIPDTDLVIDSVRSYNGIYLEDGSDIEITGVAAIILRNTGTRVVDFAEIYMTGTKTNHHFKVTGLDAGASIVVMEAGKAPAVDQNYTVITAEPALSDSLEMSEAILKVEETAEGKLKVTNLSDRDIPCVRVFYKFYMEEENLYVGGITYTAKVLDLKAGASAEMAPSHYAPGKSKVIMAKAYDQA